MRAVRHEAATMRSLVREGLEYVKADRREQTNVDRLLERVVHKMRRVACDMHHKLQISIHLDTNETRALTSVPPLPIEQTLVNLIDNALGLLPNEKWAQIRVSARLDPNDVKYPITVEVSDNGPGMDAGREMRLFLPRSTIKKELGTGLGLYVSRNLLRTVGADLVLAETARWGGARFKISLPVIFNTMDDESRP